MTILEIFELIFAIIPFEVKIVISAGIIGFLILEVKERNVKNGEKTKG